MNEHERIELRTIFLTRTTDELETVVIIAGQILKERMIKKLEQRKGLNKTDYSCLEFD